MNLRLKNFFVSLSFLFGLIVIGSVSNAQSIDVLTSSSNCDAGGEIWVCGTEQQSQAHSDYDKNCDEEVYDFESCTVIKTIVDVWYTTIT